MDEKQRARVKKIRQSLKTSEARLKRTEGKLGPFGTINTLGLALALVESAADGIHALMDELEG